MEAYFSIYGIKAPGAASDSPLLRVIKLTAVIRNLFIGGFEKLCKASTASGPSKVGLTGLLISKSFGVRGVWAPEVG
jgi:hypothetical protein